MDIHKLLTSGAKPQEIEDQLLTLDSTFRFKCRRCGKCCKNQDTIIFNPRDIYNIAHKFGKTMEQVIRETSEVYIGHDSRLPIVHMVPRGPKNACPLLIDDRCSVHDCKPSVCALFPLGRVLWIDREAPPEKRFESMQIRYIINDIDCGSAKRVNTVRDWIAQFGIAEHDEFFLLWNQLIIRASETVQNLEGHGCPPEILAKVWEALFDAFYLKYDTTVPFMPQFLAMVNALIPVLKDLNKEVEAEPMDSLEAPNGKTGTDQ